MKFYERLESWSYLLRSKALYHELKYYVKKKQTHIKRLYHFNSRGIGKTYNLMKISGKYKIPVVEPNIHMAKWASESYKKFKPIVVSASDLCGKINAGSIMLVDNYELLTPEARNELQKCILIGFKIEN